MSKEIIQRSLLQGGLSFFIQIPKAVDEKMVEIVRRDPAGTWDNRGIELLEEASKE